MLCELSSARGDLLEVVNLLLYAFRVALGELLVPASRGLGLSCCRDASVLGDYVLSIDAARRSLLTFLDLLGLVSFALGLHGIEVALLGHGGFCQECRKSLEERRRIGNDVAVVNVKLCHDKLFR